MIAQVIHREVQVVTASRVLGVTHHRYTFQWRDETNCPVLDDGRHVDVLREHRQ